MIWATVSSQSCFCWLCRVSPSLATNNIINLILVWAIQWCPYVVSSCVVGRGCLPWPAWSLGKTLLPFALLHSVLQGQTCLLLQVFLNFLILHSSPLKWKGHLFWVLVLEGLVGLHKSVQHQHLQHYWLGPRLGLPWYEWFALETNWDHSAIFETALKYYISDSCWLWGLLQFF